MNELASIIIVTYNSEKYIRRCLESIKKQDFPHEIIVVDNDSKDKTVDIVKKYPEVRLIETHANLGYGVGNNFGTQYATGEYLVFLNPDTIVEDNWLSELIMPLENGRRIITTPKILTYDGKKINTCGIVIHFTGIALTRGYQMKPSDFNIEEQVGGFSGCCFAIKKKDFKELGPFDNNFFLYFDDVEMSLRAQLKKFLILYVPRSVVRHDYSLKVFPEKIYHLEKGRYLILRKYFKGYFIIILNSLLIVEIITFTYSILCGRKGIINKMRAIVHGLTLKTKTLDGCYPYLLRSLDVEIPIYIFSFYKSYILIKIINKLFKLNYKILSRFII